MKSFARIIATKSPKARRRPGVTFPTSKLQIQMPQTKKQNLLNQFSNASKELVAAAEKWDEKELDEYSLPHPYPWQTDDSRDALLYGLSQPAPCQPGRGLVKIRMTRGHPDFMIILGVP